jgi:hypothetical protein
LIALLAFRDHLPHDIRNALREEAGQWMFGTQINPDWPANWHEVYLHKAVEKELAGTVKRIMLKAADKLPKVRKAERWELERAIDKAIERHLRDLIDAARLPPRVRKWESEIADKKAVMADAAAEHRKALKAEVRQFETERDNARTLMQGLTSSWNYPEVPAATQEPTQYGDGLPDSPGVYFVWSSDRVAYVGQSIRLSGRATKGHERIEQGDLLSWLEFPVETLDFAESFYIGVARPPRNFGTRAKCRLEG